MKRKEVYSARSRLNFIKPHPDIESVSLPPQPSILPAHSQPLLVRYAIKIDNLSRKLGPVRPALAKLKHLHPQKYISKSPRAVIKSLSFTETASPTVSIVIPVFNKFNLTASCLQSIRSEVSDSVKYEVIIVDNNSKDASHMLSGVAGLVYIRNKENLGFVEACNIGAAKAKGKYLVFLNNDALVTKNWLEVLIETIERSSTIGMVGSKIVYPDGRLQEAGGIIFQDASGWNYGRNDHPDRYQYNYVREVDYCSGASIIIEKKLFTSFGGFDMLYAPAYYEDTDLAFKVRQKGLKVIYQPQSTIYHIEGATAGTSTASGFKKYQAINHKKFIKRWQDTLSKNHDVVENVYAARDRSHPKMALLLDEFVPMPDKDSGSVRQMRFIEILQEEGYKVTLFPNHLQKIDGYTEQLQQMGVEVVYGPTPFTEFIENYGKFYDFVMLSRPRIGANFIELCQAYCTKAKIVYDTVDLHYLRLRRQAEYEEGELSDYYAKISKEHEIIEKDLMESADTTLVVSEVEAKMLEKDGVENVEVISNIHSVVPASYKKSFSDRKDLIFIGGYAHHPNIDGVKWFVDEIFPLVQAEQPDIKIHVVGSNMPSDLKEYLSQKHGVIIDGFVDDATLVKLLSSSRVFVAPMRYGAGVKGKVGQAIEHGTPVVSTTIAAEGMYLKDGTSALITDEPEAFASKIFSLYTNETLWIQVQKNAKEVIKNNFSKDAARRVFKRIMKS